jgi:hypothetical protein
MIGTFIAFGLLLCLIGYFGTETTVKVLKIDETNFSFYEHIVEVEYITSFLWWTYNKYKVSYIGSNTVWSVLPNFKRVDVFMESWLYSKVKEEQYKNSVNKSIDKT